MTDLDAVIAGLTEAQRRYMTKEAVWRSPTGMAAKCWMTFSPPATHRVLCKHGLVDLYGQISPLGLAVRERLMEKNNAG